MTRTKCGKSLVWRDRDWNLWNNVLTSPCPIPLTLSARLESEFCKVLVSLDLWFELWTFYTWSLSYTYSATTFSVPDEKDVERNVNQPAVRLVNLCPCSCAVGTAIPYMAVTNDCHHCLFLLCLFCATVENSPEHAITLFTAPGRWSSNHVYPLDQFVNILRWRIRVLVD